MTNPIEPGPTGASPADAVLVDPAALPQVPSVEDQVNAAGQWVEARHAVEQLQASNAARIDALRLQGAGIPSDSITGLHVFYLIETLLGDMDAPRRIEFETAVQTRMAELLGEVEGQVRQHRLTQGVQLDVATGQPVIPQPPTQRPARPQRDRPSHFPHREG